MRSYNIDVDICLDFFGLTFYDHLDHCKFNNYELLVVIEYLARITELFVLIVHVTDTLYCTCV